MIQYIEVPLAEKYDCIAQYAQDTTNLPIADNDDFIAQ